MGTHYLCLMPSGFGLKGQKYSNKKFILDSLGTLEVFNKRLTTSYE